MRSALILEGRFGGTRRSRSRKQELQVSEEALEALVVEVEEDKEAAGTILENIDSRNPEFDI